MSPFSLWVGFRSSQGLADFVYMFADLEQLAAAEFFVGTFSSNIGRLVHVLREVNGRPRNHTLSVDLNRWYPGRG